MLASTVIGYCVAQPLGTRFLSEIAIFQVELALMQEQPLALASSANSQPIIIL